MNDIKEILYALEDLTFKYERKVEQLEKLEKEIERSPKENKEFLVNEKFKIEDELLEIETIVWRINKQTRKFDI